MPAAGSTPACRGAGPAPRSGSPGTRRGPGPRRPRNAQSRSSCRRSARGMASSIAIAVTIGTTRPSKPQIKPITASVQSSPRIIGQGEADEPAQSRAVGGKRPVKDDGVRLERAGQLAVDRDSGAAGPDRRAHSGARSQGSGRPAGRRPARRPSIGAPSSDHHLAVSLTRRVRKPEARAIGPQRVRRRSSSRGDVTSIPCAAPTMRQAAVKRSPAAKATGAGEERDGSARPGLARQAEPGQSRRDHRDVTAAGALPPCVSLGRLERQRRGDRVENDLVKPLQTLPGVAILDQGLGVPWLDGFGLVETDPRVRREREPRLVGARRDRHPVEESDARRSRAGPTRPRGAR